MVLTYWPPTGGSSIHVTTAILHHSTRGSSPESHQAATPQTNRDTKPNNSGWQGDSTRALEPTAHAATTAAAAQTGHRGVKPFFSPICRSYSVSNQTRSETHPFASVRCLLTVFLKPRCFPWFMVEQHFEENFCGLSVRFWSLENCAKVVLWVSKIGPPLGVCATRMWFGRLAWPSPRRIQLEESVEEQ